MMTWMCRLYCRLFGHDHRYRDLWDDGHLTSWKCANCDKWFKPNTQE